MSLSKLLHTPKKSHCKVVHYRSPTSGVGVIGKLFALFFQDDG